MTQVAKAAGVSRTCASLVLNHRADVRIAKDTRQRVLEMARRLGYSSKAANAVSKQLGAQTMVYLLSYEEGRPLLDRDRWHFSVLQELHRCASHDERFVVFLSCSGYGSTLIETLRTLEKIRPLGVVVDGVVSTSLLNALQKKKLPLVVAGVTPFAHEQQWRGEYNTVSLDVEACVGRIIQWLYKNNARKLALVAYPPNILVEQLVLKSYRAAIGELGLEYDPALIQVCRDSISASHILQRYRDLGVEYDGIMFSAASLMAAALPALQEEWKCRRVPIACMAPPKMDSGEFYQAALSGLNCNQFVEMMYQQLSAEAGYPSRTPQNLLAPIHFREPITLIGT